MSDDNMILHALYDIHEYANLIRHLRTDAPASLDRISELADLILERVEQIKTECEC